MKKELYLILSVGVFISISIFGCGSTSSAPSPVTPTIGTDVVQKYNFKVTSEPIITSITLPQQFTDATGG